MVRSPEPPLPLRWSARFSMAFLDGRSGWRDSVLYLDKSSGFFLLRNSEGGIEEGRRLCDGERVCAGNEMIIVDCIVHASPRIFLN